MIWRLTACFEYEAVELVQWRVTLNTISFKVVYK
jgi:hypothetical protein